MSAAKRIWLARHLRSSAPPRAMIGASDPPLGPEAPAEAESLRLALGGAVFGKIFSSPLKRAVETARLLAKTDPEIVFGLREVDLGAWEGLTSAEARQGWPEIWEARGLDPASVAPPGGESLRDLAARVWPAWEEIAKAPFPDILVVAHQAVNRVILAKERGLGLSSAMTIDQPYGALTIIELAWPKARSAMSSPGPKRDQP